MLDFTEGMQSEYHNFRRQTLQNILSGVKPTELVRRAVKECYFIGCVFLCLISDLCRLSSVDYRQDCSEWFRFDLVSPASKTWASWTTDEQNNEFKGQNFRSTNQTKTQTNLRFKGWQSKKKRCNAAGKGEFDLNRKQEQFTRPNNCEVEREKELMWDSSTGHAPRGQRRRGGQKKRKEPWEMVDR